MVLAIYGTGGSGRELYELVMEIGCTRWEEIVFVDDTKAPSTFRNCKMITFEMFCSNYEPEQAHFAIAVGEPAFRELLSGRVRKKGYQLATIIHPLAQISQSATIADGVIIQSGAIISADANIERNVWIQPNAIIAHDVVVGENSQISHIAVIAGRTKIGKNVYIGMGACVRENITIGEYAIVSMGGVVVKSVNSNMIVIGNPAREVAENKRHRVFK